MKIAIYHPWIYVKSGLERTILEIKKRSRHEWVIVTNHYDRERTYPELKDAGVIELDRVSVERRYGAVISAAATIFQTKVEDFDADAVMVCCDGLGSLINFRSKEIPKIGLCFTPLRAVYDEPYKERHLARLGFFRPLAAVAGWCYKVIDRAAWRHYKHVFCVSDTVRQRVLEGGLCLDDKLEIAHPGITVRPPEQVTGEFQHYFFLPGRIMWTKNIELAIAAFQTLKSRGLARDFRLVVAGMVDDKSKVYLEALREQAGECGDIEFRQDLSDAEMRELYDNSYAVLFTAFNEDLGLTPLEAGSHGKPVIAAARGGPLETVKHMDTGILADLTPESFADAMIELIDQPQLARDMGTAGLIHSSLFSWDNFVEQIDCYFDRLAPCQIGDVRPPAEQGG